VVTEIKLAEAFIEISANTAQLKLGFADTEKQTKMSIDRITSIAAKLGRSFAIIGTSLTASFGYAAKGAMDLEAKLKRVEVQAGATADEIEEIKRSSFGEEFVKLGKSASEVADIYNRLASEGYKVAEMKAMLKPITEAAIVLGTEENETTKLMLNLMQQYNLEATDMTHISDVLAGALANTSFQGQELVDTMKYAGVAASELGWSLEGTIPIVDAVIKVTGEATMAGTQFRMMVNMLLDPTDKMKEEFKNVGISLNEVSEALKTPVGLIELLNKAHERGANFAAMFGARAGNAAAVIARQEIPAIEALTEKVNDAGFAHQAAGDMMDTAAGKIKAFKASMDNLRATIGDTLLPVLSELVDKETEYVTQAKAWVDANEKLASSIAQWGAGIGGVMLVLAPLMMMMPGLVIMFQGLNVALLGLGGYLGKLATGLGLSTPMFAALATEIVFVAGVISDWIKALQEGKRISEESKIATENHEKALKAFADKLGISVEKLKRWQEWGLSVSDMQFRAKMLTDDWTDSVKNLNEEMAKAVSPDTRGFKDFLDEVNEMSKVPFAIYDIMKPYEEAIQNAEKYLSEYENKVREVNREYEKSVESIKALGLAEEREAEELARLVAGRDAQLRILDEERQATEELIQAKQSFQESMEGINDKIYEFTHSEYETKLRDINHEYDLLIENAREVISGEDQLKEAIDRINTARQLEIDKLNELYQAQNEDISIKQRLADAYKTISDRIFELTHTAQDVAIKKLDEQKQAYLDLGVSIEEVNKWYALEIEKLIKLNSEMEKTEAAVNKIITGYRKMEIGGGQHGDKIGIGQIGDLMSGSQYVPEYQHGSSYVPKTGLAMLHQGEAVVPANQNTYNQQKSYSPSIVVNIAGDGNRNNVIRAVEEALNRSAREYRRTGYELIPGMS
jgi:TP901 family phage tail tape measure protein